MLRLTKSKWSIERGECLPVFRWDVTELGSDDYGTWLGARKGNPVYRVTHDGPPNRHADGVAGPQADDAVFLVNSGEWFVSTCWHSPTTELTIDISAPPILDADGWTFVDLELDLYRNVDGTAAIVDQDEFAVLAESGLVPEADLDAAGRTADQLLTAITSRREPFGDVGREWIKVLQGSSAPIHGDAARQERQRRRPR